MPIEHALWRISDQPKRLSECKLLSELELEELICADPSILSPSWMLIGRQVMTAYLVCHKNSYSDDALFQVVIAA